MNPVILALATQRLTQLIVKDEVTRPVREAIEDWANGASEFSFKDRVAVLTSCPACMSVWSGFAILAASRVRGGRWAIAGLAASGGALLVQAVISRLAPEDESYV